MSVNIKYKGSSIADITETGTKTLKTSGKYCEADIVVENTKDGGADHSGIPDYIKSAALDVASKVKAVQTDKSITFIAMSDAHQLDSSSVIVTGNLHAGMAAKALAYILPNIDFACFLGDYTAGSNTTTIEEGKQHFAEINADIDEAFSGIPQFRTVGNHDDLHYSQAQNGRILTKDELFQYIGSYNDGTVDPDNTEGGYCYKDFEDKHLRVICLNTSDYLSAGTITDTQLKWFAQTALDFSGKTIPSEWAFIVLGHHPMDWVVTPALVLKAYIDGATYSSSTWSKDFSGVNQAAFIGNFHGHIHNFLAGKLHYRYDTSTSPVTTKEFNAIRAAIPNMCFARNNEYGHNSGPEVDDIEYGEDATHNKTAGTAQDTAFCVVVIDRASKIIHAFCYGAGIDREISYDFSIAPTDLIAEYGYRDGYRISTSSGNFSAANGYVTIGYPNAIPAGVANYPNGFVIEVTGANFNSTSHSNCTWAIYQGADPTVTSGAGGYIKAGTLAVNGVNTTVELTDNGIKWTFPAGLPSYSFLRFAGWGSGANLTGTITPNV